MNDSPSPVLGTDKRTATAFGIAGCAITFTFMVLGAIGGGWIGWLTSPPHPPPLNDYSGLLGFFGTLFRFGKGLLIGAAIGVVTGPMFAWLIFRRKKQPIPLAQEDGPKS